MHGVEEAVPAKASSRVVLPQPEGPMRASTSPGRAYPLIPSRITAEPFLPLEAVTDRSSHVRNTSEMQVSCLPSPVATPLVVEAMDGSEVRRGKKMGLNWHPNQLRCEAATVLLDADRSGLVGLGVGAQRGSGDAAIDIYSLVAFGLEACVCLPAPYIGRYP